MRVREFLKQNNVLNEEIKNVDFHMNLLNMNLDDLKSKIPELKDKSNIEILNYITMIFKKCDSLNPEYDSQLDTDMVRIGLKTDQFYVGHNYNIWNNDTFTDDGFGLGTEFTSMYDDYIDSENERKL